MPSTKPRSRQSYDTGVAKKKTYAAVVRRKVFLDVPPERRVRDAISVSGTVSTKKTGDCTRSQKRGKKWSRAIEEERKEKKHLFFVPATVGGESTTKSKISGIAIRHV